MNNYIKITVGIIAILAILIIVGINAFENKTNQPESVSNVSNILEENTDEEKASVLQGSTEADMELRKGRTGDARGAQKENKGASDLQNDLNSINP